MVTRGKVVNFCMKKKEGGLYLQFFGGGGGNSTKYLSLPQKVDLEIQY